MFSHSSHSSIYCFETIQCLLWDQNGKYFHVFAFTVIRYCTPSCLYTSFHTDSGPSENSRSGVEDETHSSGPMQHLSLAITSHIVSSKCITLQQESLNPTLSPIQIYGLCASIIPRLGPKHMAQISNVTLQLWTVFPQNSSSSFSSPSPPPPSLFFFFSGLKLTVCVSAFNFLHHLTPRFYVTIV